MWESIFNCSVMEITSNSFLVTLTIHYQIEIKYPLKFNLYACHDLIYILIIKNFKVLLLIYKNDQDRTTWKMDKFLKKFNFQKLDRKK